MCAAWYKNPKTQWEKKMGTHPLTDAVAQPLAQPLGVKGKKQSVNK